MGIREISDYVEFFVRLEMGTDVSLLSFVNNEKLILKQKLKNKDIKKEPIIDALKILDELNSQIIQIGEKKVLEKYTKSRSI